MEVDSITVQVSGRILRVIVLWMCGVRGEELSVSPKHYLARNKNGHCEIFLIIFGMNISGLPKGP